MNNRRHPWFWIPTLYFTEGIPYVIVITMTTIMYMRFGLSNAENAFYTSWLYLPWVIKPFWSPLVEMFRTKRWWILAMQLVVGASLAGVAFTIPVHNYVQWTLCFFWLMAFSSATHDIAADGYYMLELTEHEQALNVGVRSLFYRIAMIVGQGALVMMAGVLEAYTNNARTAWSITFCVVAVLFMSLFLYHRFILPHPERDVPRSRKEELPTLEEGVMEFVSTIGDFVMKPQFLVAAAFLLLYRLPEALLVKICPLFLCDSYDNGGLALTTADYGFAQGTMGVIGLVLGGILGGVVVASWGFRKALWPMVCAMSLPNLLYLVLAYYQPSELWIIAPCLFIEQFGYGFGFSAYMLFMLFFSQGHSSTAHYAFCTGFMALSMMLPGMAAGYLQEMLGYYDFFILVMALIPFTFIAAAIIKVDDDFGLKNE